VFSSVVGNVTGNNITLTVPGYPNETVYFAGVPTNNVSYSLLEGTTTGIFMIDANATLFYNGSRVTNGGNQISSVSWGNTTQGCVFPIPVVTGAKINMIEIGFMVLGLVYLL